MAEVVFTSCATIGHAIRKCVAPSPTVEWAYFPIIGRGEQIRLLAAENGITLKYADQPRQCTRSARPVNLIRAIVDVLQTH